MTRRLNTGLQAALEMLILVVCACVLAAGIATVITILLAVAP